MIDDPLTLLSLGIWLMAAGMYPLGFLFGACSACCGKSCEVADGKARTDPKDEGTWVPSGSWPSVTWTFAPNPGDEGGETWFFFGSAATSKTGGGATVAEQQDWNNICNWYSNNTSQPRFFTTVSLNKRATRLPPENAVIYVYTPLNTNGPRVVKSAYFLRPDAIFGRVGLVAGSDLTTTEAAHGTTMGSVLLHMNNEGTIRNGAAFLGYATGQSGARNLVGAVVNGGAFFDFRASNWGTVNDGGEFRRASFNGLNPSRSATVNGGGLFVGTVNYDIVNDGAEFDGTTAGESIGTTRNGGTVNGGADFISAVNQAFVNGGAFFSAPPGFLLTNQVGSNQFSGTVNGGAEFTNYAANAGTVNDGAVLRDNAQNGFQVNGTAGVVNGGAEFLGSSRNEASGVVNGGAVFRNTSRNECRRGLGGCVIGQGGVAGAGGTVNDGATFEDDACTTRFIFLGAYTAHPTDIPTCNGTAQPGSPLPNECGCG